MVALVEVPINARAGVYFIAGSRVTLDTVIDSFHEGASAEDIASHYPSLELVIVYEVIAYYLRHRAELDAYLERSKAESVSLQAATEAKYDPIGMRAKLLERKHEVRG